MIYCYYDKNGVLREIINNESTRQGTSRENALIYAFFENYKMFSTASITFRVGDYVSNTEFSVGNAYVSIPYNKDINYRYFQDNKPYNFFVFEIPNDILTLGVADNVATNVSATFQLVDEYGEAHDIAGLLTFNLQSSVLNVDDTLTTSQFQYLVDRLGRYEFFAQNGVVRTLTPLTENERASDIYNEGNFILWSGVETSKYLGGLEIAGIKLYRVIDNKYKLVYSSFDDTDLIKELERRDLSKAQQLTQLRVSVEDIAQRIEDFVEKGDLSIVAYTGQYNDLKGKPNIPTQLSELVNNVGFITSAVDNLVNYYKKDETLTKEEILERIASIQTIKFEIYESLDDITSPKSNVIYLIGTASPYTEYAYIEGLGEFEAIGSTAIDLSSYVQSDDTLNTNNIIVGGGDKKVKDSGFTINSQSKNGVLLNDDTKVPTSRLVMQEIQKYHTLYTINGDTGTISNIAYGTSPYFLIVDENLLVYRRISNDSGALIYHSQQVLDNNHIRDWYLKFVNNNYTRTYVENVSHTEFDDLVVSTPTDVGYDKENRVVYLEHDGAQIGEGAVIELDGFVPFFENETLRLTPLDTFNQEYVDNRIIFYTPKRKE